jgi:membrane protease subunit HflK
MTVEGAGRRRGQGVWRRVLQPLVGLSATLIASLPLWVIVMIVLYLGSGITIVGPDEVAIVRRFGRFLGAGTAAAIHSPGLLFALPRPVDEVVRVNVKKVYEADVGTLAPPSGTDTLPSSMTIDPTRVGYALTGDHNIIHARFKAHYRVSDPVAYLIGCSDPERALLDVLTGEAVRAVGERDVDHVLAEGRSEFVETVRDRAQLRLDAADLGIVIVSLELTSLNPPGAVTAGFTAVQSAVIAAQTAKQNAQTERARIIPGAQANAADNRSTATMYGVSTRAAADADATRFRALASEYRRNPAVVRERLYRDTMTHVVASAGKREFVPPPASDRYSGLRITVPTGKAP